MKTNKIFGRANLIDKQDAVQRTILQLARKRKQIIYGARSIQAQNNLFARNTKDYDVFDKQPKKSANLLQKMLDKLMGFDYYYKKEAEHKGTWKVKGRGIDMRKGTEDDESIADYTKPDSKMPFVVIGGNRFRNLKIELQKKQAVLKDPAYEYRYAKDRDDINRIKGFIKVRRLLK
jgi:hypothetical protein